MKNDRHARIVEIIESRNVETQEELANILREEGFNVTQATVSRDIRDLKLTKVSAGTGRQKYALIKNEATYADKYTRILKEAFLSVEAAQNILVVKTVSGMAMPVAAALDAMKLPGLVGCVAGDDTVVAIVRTNDEAVSLMQSIKKIVS